MKRISRKESEENARIYPLPETSRVAKFQGNIFEYHVSERYSKVRTDKRGSIKDFSPGARLRMLKHFQKINFRDYPEPLFMTLTYPDALASPSVYERNMHRRIMARHLEKLTGGALPAAWRVEFVRRKSGDLIGEVCPHWHWLIFRHDFIHRDEVNALWKKTIGFSGYCRTEIKRTKKMSVVQMYMAKYISKDAVSPSLVIAAYQSSVGRQYGWLRKSEIPMHDKTTARSLSDDMRAALNRLAAEHCPCIREGLESSFTLYGADAWEAAAIIANNSLDDAPSTDV